MKKILLFFLAICSLQVTRAYNFSAVAPTGQTLYYNIISGTTNVEVTYPSPETNFSHAYTGYTQPSGTLTIPSTVTNNGMTYTVTTIGDFAFDYCSTLTSVTIPNSVTTIGWGAFEGCMYLSSVIIPNSVTSIGTTAFYGCYALTSITIPNSVISIGDYAFWNSGLTIVTIPNRVTTIGDYTFHQCSNLTSVTIPNSVTSIGDHAFDGCLSLTNVTIPNSVTTIGDHAFEWCLSLTSVTIPNSVISIGSSAFRGCTGLTSIMVDSRNTNYDSRNNCNAIIETSSNILIVGCLNTIIPNTVTSIGDYAFADCYQLTSVTIPNSVTSIGEYAFYRCGLLSVTIPNSVTSIGRGAFASCSFTSATINSVNSIGEDAFEDCQLLTSVTIVNSVTSIGNDAFGNCLALTSVTIPNSVTSIGNGAFYNCISLTSVTIGNSVTSIGEYAFGSCPSLSSVTIPNSVTSIGDYTFEGCSGLTSVTIGNSVNSIESNAFDGCYNIDTFFINNVTPPTISTSSFNDSPTMLVVVPCGSYQNYSTHRYWSGFNIIEKAEVTLSAFSSDVLLGVVNVTQYPHCSNNQTGIVSAVPNPHCHLVKWSDGSNSLNRTIHLDQDSTLVALFAWDTSLLSIYANGVERGTVFGSGTYEYGQQVEIGASPSEGFHFLKWSDGDTTNPRIITVVQDISLGARIESDTSLFEVEPSDLSRGWTVGSGRYYWRSVVTISAESNYGYHFEGWNDGDTSNPRQVTVCQDTHFVAQYSPNRYQIEVTSSNLSQGSVTGTGLYDYQSSPIISAEANEGYHFAGWSDGVLDNPRTFTITKDTSVQAYFSINMYNIRTIVSYEGRGNVTGGGVYSHHSDVTLLATPEYGYHFQSWSNGDTQNPLSFPATENLSISALFVPNMYNVVTHVNNDLMGLVSNGGQYDYLSSLSITANANYGYHFAGWSDGETENPREMIVTKDTSLEALFTANIYTLSLSVNDTLRGRVYGGGSAEYLSSSLLEADAYFPYHFAHWSDGEVLNPRNYVYTKDSSISAIFEINTYTVSTMANADGMVFGAGTYDYGESIQLSAQPNSHYHFLRWSDGNDENPRVVTVLKDTAFSPVFAIDTHVVVINSGNEGMGYVTGTGFYAYSESVTIEAISNYGYHFVQWNDGNTQNPRVIMADGDKTMTAQFSYNQYTVSGISADERMGSVLGSATQDYLSNIILTAVPNYGYHFVQWNDSAITNPRSITVERDSDIVADFAPNQYLISVFSNDSMMGTTTPSGFYEYLQSVVISVTASRHFHFVGWSDGVTSNPRSIVISQDTMFFAIFEEDPIYYVEVSSSSQNGTVTGSGAFHEGDTIQISASGNEHYHFLEWADGDISNPRTVIVRCNMQYVANFVPKSYHVSLSANNPTMGMVMGEGDYDYGSVIPIQAIAYNGYTFVRWSDGNTLDKRMLYIEKDTSITAFFEPMSSIDNVDSQGVIVYVKERNIHIENPDMRLIEIIDMQGREVCRIEHPQLHETIRMNNRGVFIVRIGNSIVRKCVVSN